MKQKLKKHTHTHNYESFLLYCYSISGKMHMKKETKDRFKDI